MKNDFCKSFFILKTPHGLPQARHTIFYWREKIFNFLPPDNLKLTVNYLGIKPVGRFLSVIELKSK